MSKSGGIQGENPTDELAVIYAKHFAVFIDGYDYPIGVCPCQCKHRSSTGPIKKNNLIASQTEQRVIFIYVRSIITQLFKANFLLLRVNTKLDITRIFYNVLNMYQD